MFNGAGKPPKNQGKTEGKDMKNHFNTQRFVKRGNSRMSMQQLREMYVALGGDEKRTYGLSKQALILKIDLIQK